jgi:hypothetical protein
MDFEKTKSVADTYRISNTRILSTKLNSIIKAFIMLEK